MQHIFREANECADALAKRGAHQQHLLSVYSTCPSFVWLCYVRDMADLGLIDYVPNDRVLVMNKLYIILIRPPVSIKKNLKKKTDLKD